MTEPDLLLELNSFLPPGHEYSIQGDGFVTLHTPSSNETLIGPWTLPTKRVCNGPTSEHKEDDGVRVSESEDPGKH